MKRSFLFYTILAVALVSCSTQYKSSQTPDDVYYSPAPPSVAEQQTKKEAKQDKYEDSTSSEDQYLRMKTRNYNRWSSLDDYSYWYDTRYNDFYSNNSYNHNGNYSAYYGYNHCACSCNGGGNYSIFYPGYYNPYIGSFYTGYYSSYPYTNIYVINPKVVHPNVSRPQLGGYSNSSYSGYSGGSTFKKIFSSGSNGSNNSSGTYKPTDRTYSPSSSNSSSSSSSSSSGSSSSGKVSRPGRN